MIVHVVMLVSGLRLQSLPIANVIKLLIGDWHNSVASVPLASYGCIILRVLLV